MLNATSILSLRCFATVVETQGFSSAARQLRIAPSSVTKHVQLLEEAVQVALIHRTTRRVSVTEAGERFYEQCLAILAQVDRAADVIIAEKALSGHLRVAVPPAFVAGALGPRLSDFLAMHPGLSLDVIVSSDTPDLIRARIDVAVTFGDVPPSKVAPLLVQPCTMVLCASPRYLALNGAPSTPSDLTQHPGLCGRFSEHAEGWQIGSEGNWQVVHANGRLLSDNGDLLRQACIGGAGIGYFYKFHVKEDLKAGHLVQVLESYDCRSKNLYVVAPHRKIIRPQARAFIDFIKSLAKPELAA